MISKRITVAGTVTVAILLGLCLFTGMVTASPDTPIVDPSPTGDTGPDIDQSADSVATGNSLFMSASTGITAVNTGNLPTTLIDETYDDDSRSRMYEIAPTDDRNHLLVGLGGKNSDGTVKKVTPHESVLWEQTSGVDDIVRITQTPSSVLPGESTTAELTVNNSGEDASTGGVQFNTPAGLTIDNIFFTSGIDSGEEKNSTVNIETDDSVEPGNYTVTADATVGTRTDSASFNLTVTEVDIVRVTQKLSSVSPGASTTAELTVVNPGEAVSTGGVQFNTPAGLTIDNIFFTSGIDSGEEKNSTVNIETDDSVEPGNYTVTADATVGTRTDSVSFNLTVTEGGLSRFDQTESGTIEFEDVISAIEAHNTDTQIGGKPVSFTDVIEVIKAQNQAKSI